MDTDTEQDFMAKRSEPLTSCMIYNIVEYTYIHWRCIEYLLSSSVIVFECPAILIHGNSVLHTPPTFHNIYDSRFADNSNGIKVLSSAANY